MNKYFKPVKKELHPLSHALAQCRLEDFSYLSGLPNFRLPYTHGMKSYYGEQMFSMIATGRLKDLDATTSGVVKVSWRNFGFDVLFSDYAGVHRIEVKTIYMGEIIPLSVQQERIAQYLAIYNPRTVSQGIKFRHKNYQVPPTSYVLIKLQ